MKNFWSMCTLVAISYVSAPLRPAYSDEELIPFSLLLQDDQILVDTIGVCEKTCVINENDGGDPDLFHQAAEIVKRRHMRVIIKGRCYSACGVFADAARPQVCITRQAGFYFHLGTEYENIFRYLSTNPMLFAALLTYWPSDGQYIWVPKARFEPEQSRDIRKWIIAHGGFPAEGFLEMKYKTAKRFWPTCK